jgi:tRNA A37 threonylcarbamoyladenosine dehydratase
MKANEWTSRTELLIGVEALEKLAKAHVLIAGLGGVGAYAAEQICRAGVGKMTIIDADMVVPSNRNRQLLALKSTEGQRKAHLMAQRLLDINPDLDLVVLDEYLKDSRTGEVLSVKTDYVIDAIDTISPKVFLIYNTLKSGHKLVSSMGAGGKTNPGLIQIAPVEDSHGCRLAYLIRKRLHRLGVRSGFEVVFSPEPVSKASFLAVENEQNKITTIGTISYMPAIFGCFCASVAISGIIEAV